MALGEGWWEIDIRGKGGRRVALREGWWEIDISGKVVEDWH